MRIPSCPAAGLCLTGPAAGQEGDPTRRVALAAAVADAPSLQAQCQLGWHEPARGVVVGPAELTAQSDESPIWIGASLWLARTSGAQLRSHWRLLGASAGLWPAPEQGPRASGSRTACRWREPEARATHPPASVPGLATDPALPTRSRSPPPSPPPSRPRPRPRASDPVPVTACRARHGLSNRRSVRICASRCRPTSASPNPPTLLHDLRQPRPKHRASLRRPATMIGPFLACRGQPALGSSNRWPQSVAGAASGGRDRRGAPARAW